MDPLSTSSVISAAYRRYLLSLLPVRDPALATALAAQITASPLLTKGPLLEATPPYQPGATLRELIGEGVLDPAFSMLGSRALPLDRPLHLHQEQALRKASAGRNLVVATGTGSGKTESFLVPILNALAAENAAGSLGPGVRALLLYPMNALANDQLKRLRELLMDTPQITFGRYTGDTPERPGEGAAVFDELNPGAARLPNELLSRAEMRARPPHLLLTNYAMLEYLLLRPADLELFEGNKWRFIALDEAHVYDGAKAEELGMLLRRLRDRVAPGRGLQAIATSATVGDRPGPVVDFAAKLFDLPFAEQDLITASRVAMPEGPFWGPLTDFTEEALADHPDPGAALARERTMAALCAALAAGPRSVVDLAADLSLPPEKLAQLVALGGRLNHQARPVLSARYHLFTRATEGAYTCLAAHVSLGRHETCAACGRAMFEFGACKRCGAIHLTGTTRGDFFSPRITGDGSRVWLLLDGDRPDLADEDDETLTGEVPAEAKDYYLCGRCGSLKTTRASCCAEDPRPVRRLRTRSGSPTGCLACGARGSAMVRLFDSGSEAAAAVLATALYQALPPDEKMDGPGTGRKLLAFSDSRQAAAFFAPYLESSYALIQQRGLILSGLRRATARDETAAVDDLIEETVRAATEAGVFKRRDSRQQRRREVGRWVLRELVALDERQSLEGLGLLDVRLDADPSWAAPAPLLELGLSPGECWLFLGELVRSLRQQGALAMPEDVDPRDEIFDPRRGPIYVRRDGAEPKLKVLSWLPTRGVNRRLDYVRKLCAALGCDERSAREILDGCWKFLTTRPDGWLVSAALPKLGRVFQLDHTWLTLAPARELHQCDLCRRVTTVALRGVCPTMGCLGRLQPALPQENDHYRVLYQELTPVSLVAREHTAQWTGLEAATIQQQFVRGEVNVLSCSTTFELGVDVGELSAVLLRNMPPTTANYIQRAGRAGRRSGAPALVVTYAQRRSHDLSRYAEPETMITGRVRAPYVPLGNERIDRRHAHSIALAAFFRHAKETSGSTWKNAGDFFLGGGSRLVRDFLTPVPPDVTRSLKNVLPDGVRKEMDIDGGAWVDVLCDHLEKVRLELAHDVESFEERRTAAFEQRRSDLAARFERTVNTLTRRSLIGYLANRNVLPKYGFPVDTVELRTAHCDSQVGARLELSRDLATAIYEYAPGSEVVAGGVLWRSAGIYRLPGRELITRHYTVCRECGHYREGDETLEAACAGCGRSADGPLREYCVPEFGFVADPRTAKPASGPPKASWNGATHVVSLGVDLAERRWQAPSGATVWCRSGSRGRLVVISEGPAGSGFLICDWCGWGTPNLGRTPAAHSSPLRQSPCTGSLRWRSLAHSFETDILELRFDAPGADGWHSALYALLEGAADGLELGRDDIDGGINPGANGATGVVIFDTVPGGAGSVLRIAGALDTAVAAALRRVTSCDCGEETSCYGCLRTRRNERYHDRLSRGAALRVLHSLTGLTSGDQL